MADKPWFGSSSSLDALRAFPDDAGQASGFQLRRVQQGLRPTDEKPLPAVGPGVVKIRIHTQTEHRVLYVARLGEAVYILHAFEKRTKRLQKARLMWRNDARGTD